jgi:hypothetical protein
MESEVVKNQFIQIFSPTTGYYYVKDTVLCKITKRSKTKFKGVPLAKGVKIDVQPKINKRTALRIEKAVIEVMNKKAIA